MMFASWIRHAIFCRNVKGAVMRTLGLFMWIATLSVGARAAEVSASDEVSAPDEVLAPEGVSTPEEALAPEEVSTPVESGSVDASLTLSGTYLLGVGTVGEMRVDQSGDGVAEKGETFGQGMTVLHRLRFEPKAVLHETLTLEADFQLAAGYLSTAGPNNRFVGFGAPRDSSLSAFGSDQSWADQFARTLGQQRTRVQSFLVAQRARLEKAQAELAEQVAHLGDELDEGRSQSAQSLEEVRLRSEILARQADDLSRLQEEIKSRQAEWEKAQQKAAQYLEHLAGQVHCQQDELVRLREELDRRQADLDAAAATVHHDQQSLALAREEHRAQVEHVAALRQRFEANLAELESLRQQYEQLRQQAAAAPSAADARRAACCCRSSKARRRDTLSTRLRAFSVHHGTSIPSKRSRARVVSSQT